MNRGRTSRSSPTPTGRPKSRSRSTVRRVKSPSNLKTHDDQGNMIDDEGIDTFISSLDALAKDEWRARTLTFETLIESLPEPGSVPRQANGIMPWYKSYTALRRLANPINTLFLNPRSTVVKHTTQHFAFFVQRIKDLNPPKADMCKYLLKDLLVPIIAMHAQTVNVIRTYAHDMMAIIIPLCRFKSGLPVLLERLRKDKSHEVRQECVFYLSLICKHWSPSGDETPEDHPYLTSNICTHIGNGLARALTDPAQKVRSESRTAFERFRRHYPELWNEIVQKPDGILSKDLRLKKSIINAAMQADAEGKNVDEVPAYEEGEDYDSRSLGSRGSRGSLNSWNSTSSFMSKHSKPGFRATQRSNSNTRPGAGTRGSRNTSGTLPPTSNKRAPFGNVPSSPDRGSNRGTAVKSASRKTHTLKTAAPASPPPSAKEAPIDIDAPNSSLSKKPNENYQVANQLLAAHKLYIDDLMESLRGEMNTVRDFETLLVKSQRYPKDDGAYGPSEDDVLKYYEAVYSYLDKGGENSIKLRKEMERISKT